MPISAEKLNTQPARHLVADRIREVDSRRLSRTGRAARRAEACRHPRRQPVGDPRSAHPARARRPRHEEAQLGHLRDAPQSARTREHDRVRRALEAFAVEEAASHATPADVARLEELYELASAAAQSRESQKYIRRDLDWHISVWESTHNECLVDASAHRRAPVRLQRDPGGDATGLRPRSTTSACIARCSMPSRRLNRERARRAFNTAMNDWAEQASESLHRGQRRPRARPSVTAPGQPIPSRTADTQAGRNTPLRVGPDALAKEQHATEHHDARLAPIPACRRRCPARRATARRP